MICNYSHSTKLNKRMYELHFDDVDDFKKPKVDTNKKRSKAVSQPEPVLKVMSKQEIIEYQRNRRIEQYNKSHQEKLNYWHQ